MNQEIVRQAVDLCLAGVYATIPEAISAVCAGYDMADKWLDTKIKAERPGRTN